MSKTQIVVVKLQRPIATNDDENTILSYIVNEDGEQVSNDLFEVMSDEDIDQIFLGGLYLKAYWEAEYRKGKKLNLLNPIRMEDWV